MAFLKVFDRNLSETRRLKYACNIFQKNSTSTVSQRKHNGKIDAK